MATASRALPFQVGDRVRFQFGAQKLTGKIIEDRGPLGIRGRRLYRVELPMDPYDSEVLPLAEDEMELVPSDEPPPVLDRKKVIEYLPYGLYSLLGGSMPPKLPPPRVWLCLDNLGGITYTFNPEHGLLGGESPPPAAIRNGKIAVDKRDAVVSFLESFGLSRKEAERIMRKAEIEWRKP
jgi:hypothetical protein